MKAKNLMIGDYVRHKSSKYIIQIDSVLEDGVNYEYCQGGLDYIDEDKIEPIPLTEEILKANGWQLLSNYDREAYYAPNGVFSLDFRNGLFRLIIHGNIVIIEHVHQLLHDIRICGLNELADNFKLNTDNEKD